MSSLEAQAASRKERLAQLRSLKRKAEGQPIDESSDGNNDLESKASKFVGRNYDKETGAPKVGFEETPTAGEETVELVAEELEQNELEKLTSQANKSLDLSSLQPKSVNWDLKRELEPKLSILESRTENSIIKMVKDRLQNARDNDKP
jgi:coiled-coil domain-containing protein 12